ncbi:MAG TPA: TIGR03915 family putative DNA repair protein [Desulfuromonadaceae bacterium]
MRCRYDATFEGYLCAVARCLEQGGKKAAFLRPGEPDEGGLFAEPVTEVVTVQETALALRERFVAAVSKDAFATLRYAFHSQAAGIEGLLWDYIGLGLDVGRRLHRMLAEEPVHSVDRTARRVAHEAHKFKGFVRFREVAWPHSPHPASGHPLPDGEGTPYSLSSGERAGVRGKTFLYARIEPDADILPFIAPHFCERVGDRPWMIHDLARSQAAVYDLARWRLIREIELAGEPAYTPGEEECVRLWRGYFEHLAIPERRNPRLQRQHVPVRYRKNLVEFGG